MKIKRDLAKTHLELSGSIHSTTCSSLSGTKLQLQIFMCCFCLICPAYKEMAEAYERAERDAFEGDSEEDAVDGQ